MKKIFFFIFLLNFSGLSYANSEQVIAITTFKNNSSFHQYTLLKDQKKSAFELVFKDIQKMPIARTISTAQAELIKNEATRIVWNAEYRKPANNPLCSKYANISLGTEKTNVCAENQKATGMAYGFLNSLANIIKN
jgi:hypothetical protein